MSGLGEEHAGTAMTTTASFIGITSDFMEPMEEDTCIVDASTARLTELVLSAVFLPVHIFVILAMILFRDIVKRNGVNVYASNVIMANIIMNTWRIYTAGEHYAGANSSQFHRKTDENGTTLYQDMDTSSIHWWTFKKAFALIMLLVISGSIGLVINGLRNSMFRVHRTVAGFTRRESSTAQERPRTKRRSIRRRFVRLEKSHPKFYAFCCIFLVWVFPIILTLPSMFSSSCKFACHCLFDLAPSNKSLLNCKHDGCSNIMLPISSVTIQVGFALWATYIVLLGLFLIKASRDLGKVINQRVQEGSRKKSAANELQSMENGEGTGERKNSEIKTDAEKELPADSKCIPKTDKSNGENSMIKEGAKSLSGKMNSKTKILDRRNTAPPGSLLLEGGKKSVRLLFAMFGAYVVGTAPFGIFSLYDTLQDPTDLSHLQDERIAVFESLPILAEVFCTIMLCVHLPGIKSACQSLFLAIGRGCR